MTKKLIYIFIIITLGTACKQAQNKVKTETTKKPFNNNIKELTFRSTAQTDLGTPENTVDGKWMIVGNRNPKGKVYREDTNEGPVYYFEATGDANRIEFTPKFGNEENLKGVSEEKRNMLKQVKNLYNYDYEGENGETVTYEWSARFPEKMEKDKGGIFAQWHGSPDRTLVKSPNGKYHYLAVEKFVAMLDTMYFNKHTGISKVTGKPNGWLVDNSAGGPVGSFQFRDDYMFLIIRSDANRISNNIEKVRPKPGKHLNRIIGKNGKYGTIVFEKLASEVPINQWIDFKVQIKYTKYSTEADEVLESGFVKVWMNGEQVADYKGDVGKNDLHGTYFKFGIYKPSPNGFKVDCKNYKQTIIK
jgi:heparin lyase